jgi:uncharacterized protein
MLHILFLIRLIFRKSVFALLFLAFILNACNANSIYNSSVWTIKKIDESQNDKVFYVLGTLHKSKNQHIQLSEKILKVISASSAVLLESDEQNLASMKAEANFPKSVALKHVISDDALLNLKKFLDEYNTTSDQFDKLLNSHPLAAYFFLSDLLKIGFHKNNDLTRSQWVHPGIDFLVKNTFSSQNKKIFYLEEVGEFLNASNGTCEAKSYYSNLIEFSISTNIDSQKIKSYDELSNSIWEGNEVFIENWYSTDKNISDEIRLWKKCNIEPRNRAWLAKIDDFYSSQNTGLVAVGFDHLVGNHGLLNLLKNRGYVVTNLK